MLLLLVIEPKAEGEKGQKNVGVICQNGRVWPAEGGRISSLKALNSLWHRIKRCLKIGL